ncbi:UDP-N-acetylglucosamine-dolichyl [Cantharellus anzutake]|uniref:UDP-N-acetylglucosamine-dolichyl n=1 Tax=Cantharellus anzutake TaxID=1750568 RepID=UPI00190660BA|nr:UDP-N-acetylglucosamine-dolichyl [Cantharellus anzutake]KAF8317743.1 UDP-N-acetylglucosamine-dolichyl [Cantharellus anzutake]
MLRRWSIEGALVPLSLSCIAYPFWRNNLVLPTLYASLGYGLLALICSLKLIPILSPIFKARGLRGRDRLKLNQHELPESMGVICASIYVALMILFIPFVFTDVLFSRQAPAQSTLSAVGQAEFPQQQLSVFLAALLSLLSATLLGFLDDVFDIRWRYKLPIPLIASIPLLLVYYAERGNTHIVVPKQLRVLFGRTILNLGPLYYVYMALLSTFCTNSINILAGINGIEASQSLVIACSVALNDLLYLPLPFTFKLQGFSFGGIYGAGMAWGSRDLVERHLLSLYFMLPLIGVCAGFLRFNWYPATAFPGDTLCYFCGMAFAVVGILGHFSKTLLLFFLPQIFNFLLSCPQLFGLVPCPRHRMPRYDLRDPPFLFPSLTVFKGSPSALATRILETLSVLGFARVTRDVSTRNITSTTNLTLLNIILIRTGPITEAELTKMCVLLQITGSLIAYIVRYGLAGLLYDGDRH